MVYYFVCIFFIDVIFERLRAGFGEISGFDLDHIGNCSLYLDLEGLYISQEFYTYEYEHLPYSTLSN